MELTDLAKTDARYAAILWHETGDASMLPDGPAWTRGPGDCPDEHERHDSAVAALSAAIDVVEELYRFGQDPEQCEVWVLFGADDPNEDPDPYPDVAVRIGDDGEPVVGVC